MFWENWEHHCIQNGHSLWYPGHNVPKAKSSGSIGAGEPRRDRGFIACKHHTYLYIPCCIPEQVVTNFGFTAKGCHECTSLFLFMLKRRSLMKQFEPLPGEATEETGTCLQSELMMFGIRMAWCAAGHCCSTTVPFPGSSFGVGLPASFSPSVSLAAHVPKGVAAMSSLDPLNPGNFQARTCLVDRDSRQSVVSASTTKYLLSVLQTCLFPSNLLAYVCTYYVFVYISTYIYIHTIYIYIYTYNI